MCEGGRFSIGSWASSDGDPVKGTLGDDEGSRTPVQSGGNPEIDDIC